MTAATLVAALEQKGVRFRIEGEKLKLEAPADKVPGPEAIAGLRKKKAAVLAYLRDRAQPPGNQFVSLSDPIARKTEKLESGPKTKDSAPARESVACGSPHCAGCYEVAPGVRIHPPKRGEEYRMWLERWEAKGRLQ